MNKRLHNNFCGISGFFSPGRSIILSGALTLGIAGAPINAVGAGLLFENSMLHVIEETPDKNTGLDKIYVCYDTENVNLVYNTSTPSQTKIYKYSNLGGGFAEEVVNVERENGLVRIKNVEGNYGYIVEDGDQRSYYWIVNYLPYRLKLGTITESAQSDCDATILDVTGSGEPIHYYTINGQQKTLSRELQLIYENQQWDDNSSAYIKSETEKIFESLTSTLRVTPPVYCSTYFTLTGDKFLKEWNWIESIESGVFAPHSVTAQTEAIQNDEVKTSASNDNDEEEDGEEDKDASNIISGGDNEGLGGSAPADISFIAYTTEGVMHNEWQLSRDPEFEDIEFRFNVDRIDYTFNEEGTFYLRYIGSNNDGSCETISDVYTVNIGSSELLCPNAFSPDGDGVNDKWKIAYRSLIDFKCWIFDRYGAQLYYFEDPSDGWDGTRGGKPVKSGVYYYVIQATGADGKKYKKSGDINILHHTLNQSSTTE